MPAERFDFIGAQGDRLAALLDRPSTEPRAYALFVHCFTCGKDIHAARRIAEALTALGIGVLRFDLPASEAATESLPTPRSHPMSPISSRPPLSCEAASAHRPFSSATVSGELRFWP
jgi:predicted alpha/beta-hydrolase family hydrolase